MRQLPFFMHKTPVLLLSALLLVAISNAQSAGHIDFGKDTVSMADAMAGKLTFLNNIHGGGNANATEQVNLPVDKLKDILDACAANNVTHVGFIIVKIRQNDLAHYRQHNPGTADNDLKGSQALVLRVPRQVFASAMGAKINLSKNNPLMLSLLTAGMVLIDNQNIGLPFSSTDLYFGFGSICPPPTSCDTN